MKTTSITHRGGFHYSYYIVGEYNLRQW